MNWNDGLAIASVGKNVLLNYVISKYGAKKPRVLRPLFVTYYVTWPCNLRCTFCPYVDAGLVQKADPDELNTDQAIRLLRMIRQVSPLVYFSGGEPLTRKDFPELLRAARKMGFARIAMTSNATLIDKHPEVFGLLTDLTISITTLDKGAYTQLMGSKGRLTDRAFQNFELCAEAKRAHPNLGLAVNCCVTPTNITEVRQVMEFCRERGIRFGIAPEEANDGLVNIGLRDNLEYLSLIDELLRRKKAGERIFASRGYLETIRNFGEWQCNPSVIPHLDPAGRLYWPCQPLTPREQHFRGLVSVLEAGSYEAAVAECVRLKGPPLLCGNRCYLACYYGPGAQTHTNIREFWGYLF